MSCASEPLSLRPAVAADAERLAEMDRVAGTQDRYRRICERGNLSTGCIVVAECAGQVCGFALYTLVLDEGSLNNIVIDPAFGGRGFGRRLLRHTLAVLRQAGASRCLLEVRESNEVARALYAGEGFALDGRRPGYYSAGPGVREDALLMSRQL